MGQPIGSFFAQRDARVAYEGALIHAERLGLWVNRTHPILGPVPDPPPPLPDFELVA